MFVHVFSDVLQKWFLRKIRDLRIDFGMINRTSPFSLETRETSGLE